jgi:hypothetical protein
LAVGYSRLRAEWDGITVSAVTRSTINKSPFMKRNILLSVLTLLAGSLVAAEPQEEVISAAKKLADASYSWKQTEAVPEGSRFRRGPTEGKTEKGGYTSVKMSFRDQTTEAILKGDKGAVNTDGAWQSLSAMDSEEGPGRFMGAMLRNYELPAAQAAALVADTKELKKEGDVYSGSLNEERVKTLLSFRGRRGGGGDGPEISGAKGTAKYWVKDGVLSKYEYHVTGNVSFGGNDREVDRTTTVEIMDVGTAKVEVPEAAKAKIEPAAAN